MSRNVLRDKLRLPSAAIDGVDDFLRRHATVVTESAPIPVKGLDAADLAVLGEAAAGAVEVLVTGDRDLLRVAEPPMKIVPPRGL